MNSISNVIINPTYGEVIVGVPVGVISLIYAFRIHMSPNVSFQRTIASVYGSSTQALTLANEFVFKREKTPVPTNPSDATNKPRIKTLKK